MFFYLHIPFCRQRCPYCKFALTPMVKAAQVDLYIAFLRKEIRDFFAGWDPVISAEMVESIYFGGGTPSVLSPDQIGAILSEFPADVFSEDIEICLEANPEDITASWSDAILELGVNRISLGVQTMNPDSLEAISRSSPDTIVSALRILSATGHQNVNIDFILGLPHVLSGETLRDIQFLHEMFPAIRHTSVYFLEKGRYPRDWATASMNDVEQCEEYRSVREYLMDRGLHHYEISNFGVPGYESRHNQAYWNHSEVRGFGLSAASYQNGARFENASLFPRYYAREIIGKEILTPTQIELERGMFGLRTFSLDIASVCPEKVQKLVSKGLLEIRGTKLSPTLTGIFVIDHIMCELL